MSISSLFFYVISSLRYLCLTLQSSGSSSPQLFHLGVGVIAPRECRFLIGNKGLCGGGVRIALSRMEGGNTAPVISVSCFLAQNL